MVFGKNRRIQSEKVEKKGESLLFLLLFRIWLATLKVFEGIGRCEKAINWQKFLIFLKKIRKNA